MTMPVADHDGERAADPLTTDETLTLLSNVHRRRLLLSLRADRELDLERFVPDAGTEVGTRLHHVHLPKLDEADVVDWYRDQGVVARGERFEAVRPTLTLLAEGDSALPSGLR